MVQERGQSRMWRSRSHRHDGRRGRRTSISGGRAELVRDRLVARRLDGRAGRGHIARRVEPVEPTPGDNEKRAEPAGRSDGAVKVGAGGVRSASGACRWARRPAAHVVVVSPGGRCRLERGAYDGFVLRRPPPRLRLRRRRRRRRVPASRRYGQWPWPRDVVPLVTRLTQAGAARDRIRRTLPEPDRLGRRGDAGRAHSPTGAGRGHRGARRSCFRVRPDLRPRPPARRARLRSACRRSVRRDSDRCVRALPGHGRGLQRPVLGARRPRLGRHQRVARRRRRAAPCCRSDRAHGRI